MKAAYKLQCKGTDWKLSEEKICVLYHSKIKKKIVWNFENFAVHATRRTIIMHGEEIVKNCGKLFNNDATSG